jgi:hypothetical protein
MGSQGLSQINRLWEEADGFAVFVFKNELINSNGCAKTLICAFVICKLLF